jgi:ectoine hydroxylase-related dioxygenase (phytanoyl-CoA dioxygenase family)
MSEATRAPTRSGAARGIDTALELISEDVVRQFEQDGVVLVRQALHPDWLMLIAMALQRVLGDSSVTKHKFFARQQGEFQETVRNFDSSVEIRRLLFDSPLADMLGRCMGSHAVWYYSDEFFIKDAGGCERTPWHQDTPYFPVAGTQLASVWISLDPLRQDECLEFVVGSHRKTLYDGFDPANPGDPSASYYKQGLPQLPDIQADRAAWPIVSWDIEPGDIIISSPSIIHGGGPTRVDGRRRALAVRMFGDDVVFATRPPTMPTVPLTPGLGEHLRPGDPLRSPWYPQLRPVPANERYGG